MTIDNTLFPLPDSPPPALAQDRQAQADKRLADGSASYWRTPCACGFIAKSQEEWQRHGILYQGCKKKINAKRRSEPVNDQTQQLAAVPCSSSDVELAVCEKIAPADVR